MILQPAPAGPWTMTTRMTFNPNENYEQAGLLVYGDDANYVKADLVHAGGRAVEFLREVNDVAAGFGGTVELPGDFPTTIELRIVSDGTTLTGVLPAGRRAVGAVRRARAAGERAEPEGRRLRQRLQRHRDDARRRGVRLLPAHARGCRTTTAPVTTHTLAPPSPDGAGRWYRSPVAVTLSTEAGATTRVQGRRAARSRPTPRRSRSSQDGTHAVDVPLDRRRRERGGDEDGHGEGRPDRRRRRRPRRDGGTTGR